MSEGIGFLRSGHYQPGPYDVYVSQSQIRRYNLRNGDLIIGHVRPPRETEKHYGLLKVETVNGFDPEDAKRRSGFETLTPIFPDTRFDLETDRHTLATRLINLVTPIGRGQRGLIVSPPKAGKDDHIKTNRQCYLNQTSGCAPDGRPDWRASGGSNRYGSLR